MAGKYGPHIEEPRHETVEEYIKQFTHENSQPFVTTRDVSEQFTQVTQRTIFSRLDDLAEDGRLEKRHIGANSTVWWPTDLNCC